MTHADSLYRKNLEDIEAEGTLKHERIITSPQGTTVTLEDGREVINFCANNYLGLAGSKAMTDAAHTALDRYGYGMSSVRFICGTLDVHRQLEKRIASFLGLEDTVLYSSCFDANGGLFETLLGPEDAIISDSLNHASIIDGIRLSKAQRFIYPNSDMAALEERLREASSCRVRLIVTDGVFSMDGIVAKLPDICDLADKYDALVMVDDSHATGVIGATGSGSHEATGAMGRIDIITGTFGKALGGASGGFTAASSAITDLLRQRSRPYLFSNSLSPMIASATIAALDLLEDSPELLQRLAKNTDRFRNGMETQGFTLTGTGHPIVPVMYGDARLAGRTAEYLLEVGIYAVAFSFPVVPKDKARIRLQLSAAHTNEQIDRTIEAFVAARKQLG